MDPDAIELEQPYTPPPELQSMESERAVLGALLLEPHLMDTVRLYERDFAFEHHRLIYRAMLDVWALGFSVTVRTVAQHLDHAGRRHIAGYDIPAYLAGLDPYNLGPIDSHVEILKKLSVPRRFVEAFQSASTDTDEDPDGVDVVALAALAKLLNEESWTAAATLADSIAAKARDLALGEVTDSLQALRVSQQQAAYTLGITLPSQESQHGPR